METQGWEFLWGWGHYCFCNTFVVLDIFHIQNCLRIFRCIICTVNSKGFLISMFATVISDKDQWLGVVQVYRDAKPDDLWKLFKAALKLSVITSLTISLCSMALFLSISDISLFISSISLFFISNCLLLGSAEVFHPCNVCCEDDHLTSPYHLVKEPLSCDSRVPPVGTAWSSLTPLSSFHLLLGTNIK